ncbi:MAG TPA: hypothetical protein VKV95_12915 [Terriglobia bacterium]|nr:hypothetical protein [Terriglobia bacterium]
MFRSRLSIMVASVCLFFTVGAIAQSQRTPKVMAGDATARLAQPVEPDSPGTPSTVGAGPQANGAGPGTIVPRLMKFSGALHDAAGKPVTGMVDVTFSLYSTEAGGDALWFETQSVQADDLGRYTALLGAMHTDGLPVDLFTSGEVRWLGIQVGAEAEQQPRVLLVSVPYALKAGDAETLGGKPASAYVLADAQSGTATGTATTSTSGATTAGTKGATDKSGKTNVSPLVAVCSTITSNLGGTANALPMFTAQCNIENSVITQSGGNVGIGTVSPGAQLDVQNSTAQNNIALRASNANGTMMFIPNLSAGAYNGMVQTGDQGLIFYGTVPGAGGFDLAPWSGGGGMRMTSAGNVGIGTPAPAAMLEVGGTAQFDKAVTFVTSQTLTGPQLDVQTPANQNTIALRATNANGTMMFIPNLGAGAYNGLVQAGDQGIIFYGTAPNAGNFVIGPWSGSGSPGIRLTAAGNVGIGTSTPGAKLDVNGTANFSGAATFAAGQTVTGTVAATSFAGNGALITGIPNSALSTAAQTRGIVYLAGCDSCGVLGTSDSQVQFYVNVVGNMTINSVRCFSDNNGTTTINIARHNGGPTNLLSGPLTCNGTPTSSFTSASLALNDQLDFVMAVPDNATRRITVAIQASLN